MRRIETTSCAERMSSAKRTSQSTGMVASSRLRRDFLRVFRRPPALFRRIRLIALCRSMLRRRREHALKHSLAALYGFLFGKLIVRFFAHHGTFNMKQIAIDKARKRLAKASVCLERIEASRSFGEFESAWTDLLIALDDIHTVLQQGAKTNPQSRQWSSPVCQY